MNNNRYDIHHPDLQRVKEIWDEVYFYEHPQLASQERHRWIIRRPGETDELYQARLKHFTYTPILLDAVQDFIKKLTVDKISCEPALPGIADLYQKLNMSIMLYGTVVAVILPNGAIDIINPATLINWSGNSQLDFAVLKSQQPVTEFLEKPYTVTTWNCFTRDELITHKRFSDNKPEITESQPNRLGFVPVFRINVDNQLWLAKSCYLKQRQHFVIENSLMDAATTLYVQRTLKPNPLPDDDLTQSYLDTSNVETSNHHLIEGDFKFVEPTGSSVKTCLAMLEKIETQVNEIVSRGSLNTGINARQSQSGLSKQYDYSDYENHVRAFADGSKRVLNELLTWYSQYSRESYTLFGANDFGVDVRGQMIDQTLEMLPLMEYLSDDAKTRWFKSLEEILQPTA